ncbi:MAG: hypothetical protein ACK5Q5_22180 [Planctomycetaceae bacterium]
MAESVCLLFVTIVGLTSIFCWPPLRCRGDSTSFSGLTVTGSSWKSRSLLVWPVYR